MNTVTLTADGKMIEKGTEATGDPLMFLGYGVDLDPDFRLRSFFKFIENNNSYVKLNHFFSSYMEQYAETPASDCIHDGFDHIEFSKTVEMIGFPGKPRLDIYNSLKGKYKTESIELRSIGLENLLDMPLKLGRLKHIIFGDKVDIFEFDTVYNLFELIDGIVWELSFQGTLMACELRR